eukprot:357733-Pelagomonas_calceolata.AAC.2
MVDCTWFCAVRSGEDLPSLADYDYKNWSRLTTMLGMTQYCHCSLAIVSQNSLCAGAMDILGSFDALRTDDRLREQYILTLGQLSALLDTGKKGSPAHSAAQSPALPVPSPQSSGRPPLADRTNVGVQTPRTKPSACHNGLPPAVTGVHTPEALQRSCEGSTPRVSSDKKRFRRRTSASSGGAGGLLSPPLPPLQQQQQQQQHDIKSASGWDSQGCQQLHLRQGGVAGTEQDQQDLQQHLDLMLLAAAQHLAHPAPAPAAAGTGLPSKAGSSSPARRRPHHQHTINATTLPLPPVHHMLNGSALKQVCFDVALDVPVLRSAARPLGTASFCSHA